MSRFALLGLATSLVFAAPHCACADNEAETRLINAYIQAHSAKDLEGVLSLFSERPDAEMARRLRTVLTVSFGTAIKKIELAPEKPNPNPAPNARGGKKETEFRVTYNLVIHFPEDAIAYSLISFPAGWKDGRLFLAPVSLAGRK
jgi:hypothetical protein